MDRIDREHATRNARAAMMSRIGGNQEGRLFSGDRGAKMWEMIRESEDIEDVKATLYVVCCRLQEMESRLEGPVEAGPCSNGTIKLVFPEGNLEAIFEKLKVSMLKKLAKGRL